MHNKIRLAISTCPNDTFAFHGLMNRKVDWRGLDFEIQLMDIQQLNESVDRGELDVAKASFHAALRWSDRMIVLPSGSALGFGVGPLLLATDPSIRPDSPTQVALCPGQDTTASLLFQLFYPRTAQLKQVLFSEVMPLLQRRQADFGVCIHEGRFTWQDAGLFLVEDLGTRWESETNCPLPLGGILAAEDLGPARLQTIQSVIRESLEFAQTNPELALPTMRRYAQEFDDDVLMQHVKLYVNQWTVSLGEIGQRALSELTKRACAVGLVPHDSRPLRILETTSFN